GVTKYGQPTGSTVPKNLQLAAFQTGMGTNQAKTLTDQQGNALDAAQSLQSTQAALKLLDSGTITGSFADVKLGLGKALQQVGFHGADDPNANTEAYLAQRVQE